AGEPRRFQHRGRSRSGARAGGGRLCTQPVAHLARLRARGSYRELGTRRRRACPDRLSIGRMDRIMTESPTPSPKGRESLVGAIVALALAAVIALVFVLPADFGRDPTGLGRALGITALSEEPVNEEFERGK